MSDSSAVRLFDLDGVRASIAKELEQRWQRVLEHNAFVLGAEVREFEEAFAQQTQAAGCVAVANGTDALTLVLRGLGVKTGDEVLVPAFTFFATYESVALAGAVPVCVDVDPETFLIDLSSCEEALSERTKGLVAVHLYGLPADASALDAFCQQHNLFWVEDAAQAHGATYGKRPAGSLGAAASWSFYPSKNLGCFGDGGAVTSTDPDLLDRVRCLANHGQVGRYEHALIGTNSRLDSLQAAVLNCRLPRLEQENEVRDQLVSRYRQGLIGVGDLRFQKNPPGRRSAHHQFTVRTASRDALQEHLAARQIGTAVHYPKSIPEQEGALEPVRAVPTPVSRAAGREVLSLPLYPGMGESSVDTVIDAVKAFYE